MSETRTPPPAAEEELDDEASTPPGKRLRLPLRTVADNVREMGRVYREARAGLLPVPDASRLSNMLSLIIRALEGSELARRIEELERRSTK